MSLRSLNLNLLPVLQALLRERSVSNAADVLAMSQSATSEALAKLRATFDDPLLIRVGARMELTPRAQAMAQPLDELCHGLDLFHRRPVFDALDATRTFTIASNDYATNRLAPALLQALRKQAPKLCLRFQPSTGQVVSQLAAAELDFAILPHFFMEDLPPDTVRYRPLFRDRAVAIFDRNHPLAGQKSVSKADLERYRVIAFHPGSAQIERRHLHVFTGGQPYRVAAFVPEVMLLPMLIRGSEDFAIIPEAFPNAHALSDDIVSCPLADAMPDLDVGLAWGPIQDNDSGHCWLRDLIVDSAAANAGIKQAVA